MRHVLSVVYVFVSGFSEANDIASAKPHGLDLLRCKIVAIDAANDSLLWFSYSSCFHISLFTLLRNKDRD